MINKICHLTSVHQRYDTRIFLKECQSLVNVGYEVTLIVADGKGNETKNNIRIFDVGKSSNRFERFIITTWKVYKKALQIDAKIYHFHDPELITIGLLLRLKGKRVIYDVHENSPMQLLSKPYIPTYLLRKIISWILSILQSIAIKMFDGIIVAGENILENCTHKIVLNNYPIINFINYSHETVKDNYIVYLGGITKIRGIEVIAQSFQKIKNNKKYNIKLKLIGKFDSKNLKDCIIEKYGDVINFLDWKSQDEAYKEAKKSIAGIVTYLPVPNHMQLRSNKVFEYMECGIPIIYSNFPDWKEKLDKYKVGLSVNPKSINEIVSAIEYIINNPEIAQQMGENGRKAVEEKYNWNSEEKKLWELYENLQC